MLSNSTSSKPDPNVSGIAQFCVSAGLPAPVTPIHTAKSRRTNLFPPSHRIAGSEIPIHCMKAAAMQRQLMLGEPDVRSATLPCDMHAARERYKKVKITWDMLKNQTASRMQSSNEYLYRFEIKRVRLVNTRLVTSPVVANKKGLFQVPTSVLCYSFSVANSFKARIVNFLGRWLFVCEAPVPILH